MPQPARVVAVLVSNPALSAILSGVLASAPVLRVRQFDSLVGLTTYMRLATVDLIVCDFDGAEAPAGDVAEQLRRKGLVLPDLQMIALASSVTPATKRASIEAGIDEIIVKPMSPRYLLERVLARLHRSPVETRRPVTSRARFDPAQLGDNVIPLFGPRPAPLH